MACAVTTTTSATDKRFALIVCIIWIGILVEAVTTTTSSLFISSLNRSGGITFKHSRHPGRFLYYSSTIMRRRRHSDSASATNAGQQRLLSSNQNTNDDSSTLPNTNRGIFFGGWEQAVYERTMPLNMRPSSSHVWVKVHAVGLNPVDAKGVIGDKLKHDWTRIRKWAHRTMVQDTRVGFDFAGVVVIANTNNDHNYPAGTRVFGSMPPLQGSCAEYIKVPLHQIARAPEQLTLTESAALPLVGLTAWQALSPYMLPRNNNTSPQRVLIIGGSGGTGHVALQVAKALGAVDLVTVCSTRNIDFVTECGATRVVDYSKTADNNDLVQDVYSDGPFDLILDCVTSADPEDAQHQYPTLIRRQQERHTNGNNNYLYQRLGGEWTDWIRAGMARIFPKTPFFHKLLWKDPRERLFWIRFPHSSHELQELARLANQGSLKPRIQKVYKEFSAATVQQAFDDITSRRVQGKVVVQVVPDTS